MVLNIIGTIVFIIIILIEKLYYSFAWWDSFSFLVVLLGSVLVWFLYFIFKHEWDFFAQNASVFIGLAYGIIWGIKLMFSDNISLIYPLVVIPIGYGCALGIISNLIYRRHNNADKFD